MVCKVQSTIKMEGTITFNQDFQKTYVFSSLLHTINKFGALKMKSAQSKMLKMTMSHFSQQRN